MMRRSPNRSDAFGRRLGSLLLAAVGVAALCALPATAPAQGPQASQPAASTPAPAPAPIINAHPTWAELDSVQQRILAPLGPLWDTLPEINRHKWMQIAARYPKFSPEEQARLQTRMAEWVKLTPQQRKLARENYQITRSLPQAKKAEAWDKYQQLPEDQKKKLAAAEKVPRHPGAVSALPTGKRLPVEPSQQLHADSKKPASGVVPKSAAGRGTPAPVAASAVHAAPPASAPAAAPAPAAPAPSPVPTSSPLPGEAAATIPAPGQQ